MDLQADSVARYKVYKRLQARNRFVGVLRIAVPLLGVIALAGLMLQIFLSGLGDRFGVGQITVSNDQITVETPKYAGVFGNGTTYVVTAREAKAAVQSPDLIALTDAVLTMSRPDGVVMEVKAPESLLDTGTEIVVVEGRADVANSLGTTGVISNSVFDYSAQQLVGNGPVDIQYADGATIVANGITYDAARMIWTFTRATVTLPSTPGAETTP